MPRARKTEQGETIQVRVIRQLRHDAQVESWAWRFATHRVRVGWQKQAACIGTDTEQWFDEDRSRRREVLPVCFSCPVRLDCGTEAMETEQRHTALVHGARAGFGAYDRYKQGRLYDRLTQSA
jgi:hypothetical protein